MSQWQTDMAELVDVLQKPTNVHFVLQDSFTPLGFVCSQRATDTRIMERVSRLLELGAEMDSKNGLFEYTPLHCAAGNDHVEIAKLLLSCGATVDSKNKVCVNSR